MTKIQNDNLSDWADAHVFYGMYENNISKKSAKFVKDEYFWRHKLLNETPNGSLLLDNTFLNDLKKKDTIYLAHTTPNLHNIQENRILYPSAG